MDAETKKQVLRKISYGMWVLSAASGEDVEASSVTWVTQVSFTPPLVAVAIKADSHLARVVEGARAFVLHLLGSEQKELAEAFTKPTQVVKGAGGTIGGLSHKPAPATGAPLLEGFSCWLEARVTDTVKRGDHTLFVAEVVDAGASDLKTAPLTLAAVGWNYGG